MEALRRLAHPSGEKRGFIFKHTELPVFRLPLPWISPCETFSSQLGAAVPPSLATDGYLFAFERKRELGESYIAWK